MSLCVWTLTWYNPFTCPPGSFTFSVYFFSVLLFWSSLLSCRVTREYRENLTKVAKQLSNKAKDSLRRVRSNAVTQIKKAKEGHSEDTIRLVEKQVGDRERERNNSAQTQRVSLSFMKLKGNYS